jgi:hypothetical protein
MLGSPATSMGHFALGFLSGVTGDRGARVGTMAFSGYELTKLAAGETLSTTLQKVAEFGAGLLIARMIGGGR